MSEEKNGVTKSSSNGEMSPQEDGTKVPLTSDSSGAGPEVIINGVKKSSSKGEMSPHEDGTKVPLTSDSPGAEVKFTSESTPNGDTKVEIGPVPKFSGLTKDELMKYSDDPYWVNLRWFLFIFFWASWLLMLIVAIIVIVLAPRCKPPPTLQWIQESPMLQYSNMDDTPQEFVEVMKSMEMKTAYIPDVINPKDFDKYTDGNEKKLQDISTDLSENGMNIATDFMADTLPNDHAWATNSSFSHLLGDDGYTMNYTHPDLITELEGILTEWVGRGFAGFVMDNTEAEGKANARDKLNERVESLDEKGAVVSGIVDMASEMPSFAESGKFNEFLQHHIANSSVWNYYLYNPLDAVGSREFNQNHVPLVTLALFLVPGTPILRFIPSHSEANTTIDVIKHAAQYRDDKAVKFGDISFVNVTEGDNVVAYTRLYKGVPGYAIAVNLESLNKTVDFSSLNNIPEKGKLKYHFVDGMSTDVIDNEESLKTVVLKPYEGKVIQFVPKS